MKHIFYFLLSPLIIYARVLPYDDGTPFDIKSSSFNFIQTTVVYGLNRINILWNDGREINGISYNSDGIPNDFSEPLTTRNPLVLPHHPIIYLNNVFALMNFEWLSYGFVNLQTYAINNGLNSGYINPFPYKPLDNVFSGSIAGPTLNGLFLAVVSRGALSNRDINYDMIDDSLYKPYTDPFIVEEVPTSDNYEVDVAFFPYRQEFVIVYCRTQSIIFRILTDYSTGQFHSGESCCIFSGVKPIVTTLLDFFIIVYEQDDVLKGRIYSYPDILLHVFEISYNIKNDDGKYFPSITALQTSQGGHYLGVTWSEDDGNSKFAIYHFSRNAIKMKLQDTIPDACCLNVFSGWEDSKILLTYANNVDAIKLLKGVIYGISENNDSLSTGFLIAIISIPVAVLITAFVFIFLRYIKNPNLYLDLKSSFSSGYGVFSTFFSSGYGSNSRTLSTQDSLQNVSSYSISSGSSNSSISSDNTRRSSPAPRRSSPGPRNSSQVSPLRSRSNSPKRSIPMKKPKKGQTTNTQMTQQSFML